MKLIDFCSEHTVQQSQIQLSERPIAHLHNATLYEVERVTSVRLLRWLFHCFPFYVKVDVDHINYDTNT
jgi:hypothetical protein